MRKINSIHQELFLRFLLAAVLPELLLVLLSHLGLWRWTAPAWITAVLITLLSVGLSYLFSRPYMKAVVAYREAQKRLEGGDFTVRVDIEKGAPRELREICSGFNRIAVRTEEIVAHTKRVAEEQRTAELSALESQINPHFLYNTLDAINWKAIENEQYEISELLGALADVFRHSVQNTGGITTLGKALGWCRQYILLQSVKWEKEPELIVKVAEELREFRMHKLLLQPFVENAVKHAFSEKEGDCVLTIEAKMLGEQLHITIGDNGCGMEETLVRRLNNGVEDNPGHVGIANVQKRLKLYYGDEANLYFESVSGSFTRVHLFLPLIHESETNER